MADLNSEIQIKASIFSDGLRIEKKALEGMGTKYKEAATASVVNYHLPR